MVVKRETLDHENIHYAIHQVFLEELWILPEAYRMQNLPAQTRYFWKTTLLKVRENSIKLHACLVESTLENIDEVIYLSLPKGFSFQREFIESEKRVLFEAAEVVFQRKLRELRISESRE